MAWGSQLTFKVSVVYNEWTAYNTQTDAHPFSYSLFGSPAEKGSLSTHFAYYPLICQSATCCDRLVVWAVCDLSVRTMNLPTLVQHSQCPRNIVWGPDVGLPPACIVCMYISLSSSISCSHRPVTQFFFLGVNPGVPGCSSHTGAIRRERKKRKKEKGDPGGAPRTHACTHTYSYIYVERERWRATLGQTYDNNVTDRKRKGRIFAFRVYEMDLVCAQTCTRA